MYLLWRLVGCLGSWVLDGLLDHTGGHWQVSPGLSGLSLVDLVALSKLLDEGKYERRIIEIVSAI